MAGVKDLLGRTLTTLFGRGNPVQRGATALGYYAAGTAVQHFIGYEADQMRNFYGSSRYESMYGAGAETASSVVGAGKWLYGLSALAGRDPITKAINSANHVRRAAQYLPRAFSNKLYEASEGFIGKPSAYARRAKKYTQSVDAPRLGIKGSVFWGSILSGQGLLASGLAAAPFFAMDLASKPGLLKFAGRKPLTAELKDKIEQMRSSNSVRPTQGAFSLGHSWTRTGVLIGGGAYLGYQSASNNNNPVAEGNITDISRGSGVSRLNLSTAGLGLAIHNNSRRY